MVNLPIIDYEREHLFRCATQDSNMGSLIVFICIIFTCIGLGIRYNDKKSKPF
jgi:hypothetical protein